MQYFNIIYSTEYFFDLHWTYVLYEKNAQAILFLKKVEDFNAI